MVRFEFSSAIEDAVIQRISHPDFIEAGCVRLIHNETEVVRVDKYGTVLAIYWYPNRAPSQSELAEFDKLVRFVRAERWLLYPKQKLQILNGAQSRESLAWRASEHGVTYELRANHGASPGLFLDQRQQRLWVCRNAAGRRVLNLFCYTSGFALNALKGDAKQVISVDISASALAWSRNNVLNNSLDSERAVFLKDDSRNVLRRSFAKGTRYDIVVCDPPTFSHGKGSAFSLKREFRSLLHDCSMVVAPGGQLLFSTNFEGILRSEFEVIIRDVLGRRIKEMFIYRPTFDYRGDTPWGLKSCLVSMVDE